MFKIPQIFKDLRWKIVSQVLGRRSQFGAVQKMFLALIKISTKIESAAATQLFASSKFWLILKCNYFNSKLILFTMKHTYKMFTSVYENF